MTTTNEQGSDRRSEILREIQLARKEFKSGQCKPATPGDLLKAILSSGETV